MRLYRLRDAIRQELSMLLGEQTLDDGLLDYGLRQALISLAKHLPTRRAILTLDTTGQVQNLLALAPDIYNLTELYYPYESTDPLHRNQYPVTICSPDRVEFYYCEPQAGERVEVVYHALYTIQDLFQATTDTLPNNSEHPVVLCACSHILQVLETRRRLSATDPKTAPPSLTPTIDNYTKRSIAAADDLTPTNRKIAWPMMGL